MDRGQSDYAKMIGNSGKLRKYGFDTDIVPIPLAQEMILLSAFPRRDGGSRSGGRLALELLDRAIPNPHLDADTSGNGQ